MSGASDGKSGPAALDALVAGREEPLIAVTQGAVRILIFNRPAARNALTRAMRETYARELKAADADDAIAAIIVTGAHGVFSAGVDVKEIPPGAPPPPMVRPHPVEAARAMTKPVIALVDGLCMTGGLELALGCSFIIANDRARFADTHIKLGIFPGWGLVSLLSSAIGARRAAQMQMSGEFIDAQRAYEWGIVNEIAPVETVFERCLDLANRIAAHNAAKIQSYVALNRQLDGMQTETALTTEAEAVDRMRASQ
jgi:enoyl-CoA hydratase